MTCERQCRLCIGWHTARLSRLAIDVTRYYWQVIVVRHCLPECICRTDGVRGLHVAVGLLVGGKDRSCRCQNIEPKLTRPATLSRLDLVRTHRPIAVVRSSADHPSARITVGQCSPLVLPASLLKYKDVSSKGVKGTETKFAAMRLQNPSSSLRRFVYNDADPHDERVVFPDIEKLEPIVQRKCRSFRDIFIILAICWPYWRLLPKVRWRMMSNVLALSPFGSEMSSGQ